LPNIASRHSNNHSFDSNANEVFRNQGFMPKAAIMEQTKKVGVS
jgi:hypothetical protein